jgi:hypothetical protein
MKKKYSFYSLLTAIPVGLLILVGLSSGQTGNYSGSPSDGGANCTACHSAGANFGGTPVLSGFPATYVPGQQYNLTLAITGSSVNKFGFNITSEETASNTKIGRFANGTGSQLRPAGVGLTHTAAGNAQNSWNFTWVAPATNVGDIRFYYATMQANNNGASSGDHTVVGTSLTTLGINNAVLAKFTMFPTLVDNHLTIELQNADSGKLRIYNLTGALVQEQTIDRLERLALGTLKTGMYFVNITVGGSSQTERIFKN